MIFLFAGIIFIFSDIAVAFWMSDYFRKILKVKEDLIFTTFSVIRFTGPVMGMLISGLIVQKCGGYESKHSILFAFLFSAVECICGIFMTRIDKLEYLAPVLWCVSFFFGCTYPILIGIIFDYFRYSYNLFA